VQESPKNRKITIATRHPMAMFLAKFLPLGVTFGGEYCGAA
jgi:hypothetical protein